MLDDPSNYRYGPLWDHYRIFRRAPKRSSLMYFFIYQDLWPKKKNEKVNNQEQSKS